MYIYIHIYIIYNVYIYISVIYIFCHIYIYIYIYIYMTERQTDMKIINTKNQDSVCGTLVFQDRTRCQKTFRENGCEGWRRSSRSIRKTLPLQGKIGTCERRQEMKDRVRDSPAPGTKECRGRVDEESLSQSPFMEILQQRETGLNLCPHNVQSLLGTPWGN